MSVPLGRADLHSHLFPGVDDGARHMEDALAGLRALSSAGVTRLVTTPHFAASWTEDPERLESVWERMDLAWQRLREGAAAVRGIEIQRGHEIALDKPDMRFDDDRLRLGGTSFALVEWPRFNPPPAAALAIQRIREAGVRPIIAHVERYAGTLSNLQRVFSWREAGALTQVNYGSLMGQYGPEPRAAAMRLLERGWVDVFSTDLHPVPGFQVHIERVGELMARAGAEEQMELLSSVNPRRILDDEEPLPASPILLTRGIWERFRDFMRRR